jgi:hypothetical protein
MDAAAGRVPTTPVAPVKRPAPLRCGAARGDPGPRACTIGMQRQRPAGQRSARADPRVARPRRRWWLMCGWRGWRRCRPVPSWPPSHAADCQAASPVPRVAQYSSAAKAGQPGRQTAPWKRRPRGPAATACPRLR